MRLKAAVKLQTTNRFLHEAVIVFTSALNSMGTASLLEPLLGVRGTAGFGTGFVFQPRQSPL